MRSKLIFLSGLLAALVFLFSSCQQADMSNAASSIAGHDLPYSSQSKEALKHLHEGLIAFDLGDDQQARTHFEQAIEADPDFAVAYVYRSFTSRSPQEFAADVKMANEKNENLSEADKLMVGIDNAYLSGDVNKRLTLVKAMVEKYPDKGRPYLWMGITQNDMNDHAAARKSFEKAIEVSPDWVAGYSALGNSYIFNEPKDLAKAEANMKKMVELMPEASRAHIALGDVYRAQQNLEKALASYQKAAELAPNDPVAFSKAGHANTYLGNFEAARTNFEKSGSLSDFPAAALNFTAFTHLYEGEHAKGMAWLKEKAMGLDQMELPRDRLVSSKANLLFSCFMTAYHLGDAAEMKAIMETMDPLDEENAKGLGTTEAMMEQIGRKSYRDALVALVEGDLAKAREMADAQQASLDMINNPTKLEGNHFLRGEIAMKDGNAADAIAHYEQANLNDPYVKYKLALAHKAAGNAEKANGLLNEVANYNFNNLGYALVRKEVKDMLAPAS